MTMTEWFLAELESEAAKTRRVLAEMPEGKRQWKPHERSMEFGYLCDLVANSPYLPPFCHSTFRHDRKRTVCRDGRCSDSESAKLFLGMI